MQPESLEDTWHDIIIKAMKGLLIDPPTLARWSNLSEEQINSLLAGKFDSKTLLSVAPALGLHPKALVDIACDAYQPKPIQLPSNFKRFTTSYYDMKVNSYLLWSDENKTAVAFDTGTDLTPLLKELEQHKLKLHSIFLTHGHADHILKLKELLHQTGASAWINEAELIQGANVLPLHHSWKLDSHITIESRWTPGHSAGGTVYVIHGCSHRLAIVGDALFAGSIGGTKANYPATLEMIRNSIFSLPKNTILAPGHGPLTTVGEEMVHNPFFAIATN